eukprot:7770780-Lingulodinium_polyedra.AAC.1
MRIQSRRVATMVACSPTPRSSNWAPASMGVVRMPPGWRLPPRLPCCWTLWTMAPGSLGNSSPSISAGMSPSPLWARRAAQRRRV